MHLAIYVAGIQTQNRQSPGDLCAAIGAYLLKTMENPGEVVGGELAMRVGGVVQKMGQRGVRVKSDVLGLCY